MTAAVRKTAPNPDHPAPFTAAVLDVMQVIVNGEARRLGHPPRVLDPFAGVGRVHQLTGCATFGVEIEPEWAACHEQTEVGDAAALTFGDKSFDAVVTSPAYGNRMADAHDNRDRHKKCEGEGCLGCRWSGVSPRKNYRAALGRLPTSGSSATMQWGDAYRDLHRRAIAEMRRVVKPGGAVAVNMSNHVRQKKVVPVVEWWVEALVDAGLNVERLIVVDTPRMRRGQNHAARVEHEHVIMTRRSA